MSKTTAVYIAISTSAGIIIGMIVGFGASSASDTAEREPTHVVETLRAEGRAPDISVFRDEKRGVTCYRSWYNGVAISCLKD